MTKPWNHFNPVTIVSGVGCFNDMDAYTEAALSKSPYSKKQVARKVWLIVTTAGSTKRGWTKRLVNQISDCSVHVIDQVTPNPELDDLQSLTDKYKKISINGIIALGGGSALDAAKVLSVTLAGTQYGTLRGCLINGIQNWCNNLPVITVPTTSGTGSEVTPFATVWDRTTHSKYSVTGNEVFPFMAVLDPMLTVSLPYQETLYTGLDATSHALESIWNKNANPISKAHAIAALQLIVKALPQVLSNGENIAAREQMQHASMLAGLAISHTRTAIAHSISYPITSHYNVPHGLACSFTLPYLLQNNLELLGSEYHGLLGDVLKLLENLRLDKEMRKYIGDADLMKLREEMHTPGRADNYISEINLEKIIQMSV